MTLVENLVETRGTIRIDSERCKGCELCIPACPPRVLRMSEGRNTRGARVPELLAGCTGCSACLLVCPDFCIEVYQYAEPIMLEVVNGSERGPGDGSGDGSGDNEVTA